MKIEKKSYCRASVFHEEGTYIHRYYLPEQLELQPPDMEALYQTVSHLCEEKSEKEIRALMLAEPCCIHYRIERITKEIPANVLLPAIDACFNYHHDRYDYNLTFEDTNFLMSLNEQLRKLEHDINAECYRLNREMQERQAKGEPFLDDYEIDVDLQFMLRSDHPLSREDDDNFIYGRQYRKTDRTVDLEGWRKEEREVAEEDYNDLREVSTHILFNVSHCWLFHELQSHSPVPPNHLCSIGTIWVDIKAWHQRFIEIENKVCRGKMPEGNQE